MTLVLLVTLAVGCENSSRGGGKTNTGMVKSTGKFNQGYQDGTKEAQRSIVDFNGAGVWLWMTDAEYQQGYNRGWDDGRRIAKLKSNEKKQFGSREPLRPRPSPELLQQQQQQNPQPAQPSGGTTKSSSFKKPRK